MVKVKVYNGWVGCYVGLDERGKEEYEGGSMDNYEFNSKYNDYDYIYDKCLELYNRLCPYSEVMMFKFNVYDTKGKFLFKGKYNDTPYRLTGDRSEWSSLKLPYTHVVISKVKELDY